MLVPLAALTVAAAVAAAVASGLNSHPVQLSYPGSVSESQN